MRQRHPHSKNMSCGNIAVRGLVKEIYFDVYSHIFTLINFNVSYSNVLSVVPTWAMLLSVCRYRIKVRTSSRKRAATDAYVYIKLYDTNWVINSGWRQIDSPSDDFEKGRSGLFYNILICM